MNRFRFRLGSLLAAVFVFGLRCLAEGQDGQAGDEGSRTLKTLQFKYEVAFENLDVEMSKDVLAFNKQYLAALGRIRDEVKAEGDVDGLVKVIAETKNMEVAGSEIFNPTESTTPKISKLRVTYAKGVGKFERERNAKVAKLTEAYMQLLEKEKNGFVAREDVDNAVKAKNEIERLTKLLATVKTADAEETPRTKERVPVPRPGGDPKWISKGASYTISAGNKRGSSFLSREEDTLPGGDTFTFIGPRHVNPYIVIDLKKQKVVSGMHIMNRTGMDKQRARSMTATISPTRCFDGIEPAWDAKKEGGGDKEWKFELPEPLRGRYIKLGIHTTDQFHLSHAKIFGWESKDQSHAPIPPLTAAEKTDLERGLVLHFPFDRSPFSKLVSSAEGKVAATASGAKFTRSGHTTGAMNFDGKDDVVEVEAFDWGAPFTVSAWAFYREFNNGSGLLQFGNGWAENSIMIGNEEDHSSLAISLSDEDKNEYAFVGSGFWVKDQWVHITLAVDKDRQAIVYKNGQIHLKKKCDAIPGRGIRSKQYFGTSSRPGVGGHFDGLLDDLRFYDRALSGPEVSALFKLDGGYGDLGP